MPKSVIALVILIALAIGGYILSSEPELGYDDSLEAHPETAPPQRPPAPSAAPVFTGQPITDASRMARFKGEGAYYAGDLEGAIAYFDAEIDGAPEAGRPQALAMHWQRGIALYQVGRYKDGADQFALHQTVNEADVENAAWHLLCLARTDGGSLESARDQMIEIDLEKDTRVPMDEVYALYAGTGTEEDVYEAAKSAPNRGKSSQFYADLYVGLLREVQGDLEGAKEAIDRAAAAPGADLNYMGRVAIVHQGLLDERLAKGEDAPADTADEANDDPADESAEKATEETAAEPDAKPAVEEAAADAADAADDAEPSTDD